MIGRFESLTRDQECARLIDNYGADGFDGIAAELDRQIRTIHNRAQVLLQICGMLMSASILVTTGKLVFGGIATDMQRFVGYLIVVAGALLVAAAGVIVGGVLSIRFISQHPGDGIGAWVVANLRYRDAKTFAYRVSIAIVLASVLVFQIAIGTALVYM